MNWSLCQIEGVWLLLRDGKVSLASKAGDIYDAAGVLVAQHTRLRDYAPAAVGAPDRRLEPPRGFYLEEAKAIFAYLQKIATPTSVAEQATTLQKPVIDRPAADEREEMREILLAISEQENLTLIEDTWGFTLIGVDPDNAECRCFVKGTDVVPANHPGSRIRARNRWFSARISKLLAEYAAKELEEMSGVCAVVDGAALTINA